MRTDSEELGDAIEKITTWVLSVVKCVEFFTLLEAIEVFEVSTTTRHA